MVSEFFLMHLFHVKLCLQTHIFSVIYYYLYRKTNKMESRDAEQRGRCEIWMCRLFYVTLVMANLFALLVAVLDVIF